MEIIHSVLVGDSADIDDHAGDLLAGIGSFGCGHKMDGLCGNDAGQVRAVRVADQHLAGYQGVFIPAAQRDKPQASVGLDGVDHESHFIRMGVQHQDRFAAGVFLSADVKVSQEILLHFAQRRGVLPGGCYDIILESGSTGGVGQRLDHLQDLRIDIHWESLLCILRF